MNPSLQPLFERYPVRVAHRGASGEAPENTLPAIQLAIEKYRCDLVEIDIRLTQDRIPVVFHDVTLERTTDGQGAIDKYSLRELKEREAGFWFNPEGKGGFPYRGKGVMIPTLEEVLKEFPETRFCLEIKGRGEEIVERTLEVIGRIKRKAPLLLGSFNGKIARRLRRLAPQLIQTIFAEDEVAWTYLAFRLGFQKISPQARYAFLPRAKYGIRLDHPRWIEFLHRQGIRVFYWTVNDSTEMETLLQAGADGLITDYPDRLNQVLNWSQRRLKRAS